MANLLLPCVLLFSVFCYIDAASYQPAGGWTGWSQWTKCGSTCIQTRTRRCLGSCSGSGTQTKRCCTPCTRAKWSSWGALDESKCPCAPASRTRRCIPATGGCIKRSYKKCSGSSSRTEACGASYKSCQWESWGAWGTCSKTCYGQQQSTRQCKNKCTNKVSKNCVGPDTRTQACGKADYWGSWSNWRSCSKTCGGGQRSRSRVCNSCDSTKTCSGSSTQTEQCNTQVCCNPVWNQWAAWSACTTAYGPGCQQNRIRTCGGSCAGKTCPGMSSDRRDCAGVSWSAWGAYGSCDTSRCTQQRSRVCRNQCNAAATGCSGSSSQTKTCVNCNTCTPKWSAWGAYGSCVGCGAGGKKTRSRTCNVSPSCGIYNPTCSGSSTMTASCYGTPCSYK